MPTPKEGVVVKLVYIKMSNPSKVALLKKRADTLCLFIGTPMYECMHACVCV